MSSKYELIKQHVIGKGSFGCVYLGRDRATHRLVAIKVEDRKNEETIKHEFKILSDLWNSNRDTPEVGIVHPLDLWSNSRYYFMVTDLYGPNLNMLHQICKKQFSIINVLRLGEQMLGSIEYCHRHGIMHRDIKPSNFLVNYGLPHQKIYLIDFGLARNIKGKPDRSRAGSLRYMSVHVHNRESSAPRDDLHSLCYTLLYLCRGSLPWSSQNTKHLSQKEKHAKLYKDKMEISNRDLLLYANERNNALIDKSEQPGQPEDDPIFMALLSIMDYVFRLDEYQTIDYGLIREHIKAINIPEGATWDWNKYYI